jgi:hypothetical protein
LEVLMSRLDEVNARYDAWIAQIETEIEAALSAGVSTERLEVLRFETECDREIAIFENTY